MTDSVDFISSLMPGSTDRIIFFTNELGDHTQGSSKICKQRFGARRGETNVFTGICYPVPVFDYEWEPYLMDEMYAAVGNIEMVIKTHPQFNFHLCSIESTRETWYTRSQLVEAFEILKGLKNLKWNPMYKELLNIKTATPPIIFNK